MRLAKGTPRVEGKQAVVSRERATRRGPAGGVRDDAADRVGRKSTGGESQSSQTVG